MVAQSDIIKIAMLNTDLAQVQQALHMADTDFAITAMTWSTKAFPFEQVTIQTADMPFPPQMVEAVKTLLSERQQRIYDELKQLGITDIELAERHEAGQAKKARG